MSNKNATRRGFFVKAGAVLSAPAALAGAVQATATHAESGSLAARLAELEDENALRRISAGLIGAVKDGSHDALECSGTGLREILLDNLDSAPTFDFSNARGSARVRLRCTARFAAPIEAPGSALLDMARAQGEGFVQSARTQMLEIDCEKSESGWSVRSARLD